MKEQKKEQEKEKKDRFDKDSFRLINGVSTEHSPYGYCHYAEHRGYISKSFFKTHKCAKKQCRYFEPNPTHIGVLRSVKANKVLDDKKALDKQLRKEYLNGVLSLEEYKMKKAQIQEEFDSKLNISQKAI